MRTYLSVMLQDEDRVGIVGRVYDAKRSLVSVALSTNQHSEDCVLVLKACDARRLILELEGALTPFDQADLEYAEASND